MRRSNEQERPKINGEKFKVAIVVSRFNSDLTDKMLEGAIGTMQMSRVKDKNISVVSVPGSFEIPLACQKLARTKKYDGIIALGCVIKGETDHYRFVAGETSRGIMQVMLDFSIPIGFGIITANNLEQAIARSYGGNNKGREAAEATLEMISKFKA